MRRSKAKAERQLERAGVVDRGDLTEGGRGVRGKRAGTEVAVAGEIVAVVQEVEGFGKSLDADALRDAEGAAEAGIDAPEIVALAGIAGDEGAVDDRTSGRALDGGHP